jgi:hypothetical protein
VCKIIHLKTIASMKITCSPRMALIVAAAIFLHHNATATTPATVNLGSASSFAILAGSQITDAGGASTIVTGDVGLSPTSGSFIGLTAGQVPGGTIYAVDAAGPAGSVNNPGLLTTAKNDLTNAFNDAAGRPFTIDYGVVDNQLGGQILFPGVYRFGHAATANLIGTLTLDANGETNPVWIFQATSDLITASDSSVSLIGASACDVFWQVGTSATLGTGTAFVGHIMADQSIGLNTGATLDGSAMARIALVSLDHNTITGEDCNAASVPDTGSTLLLLSSGLATLFAFSRWAIIF